MYIMVPLKIDASNLQSSTIAEPDIGSGEALWVSGQAYAVGNRVIRLETHRVYECVKAVDAPALARTPESAPDYWLDVKPTNKWAFADDQINTATQAANTLTLVLRPGFINALALYGVDAFEVDVTVREEPGGAITHQSTNVMQETPEDWYEWLFSPITPLNTLVIDGLLPDPMSEVTVTLRAGTPAELAKLGMLVAGDLRSLIGESAWGGTEDGASAEPFTYSYINTDKFGVTQIQKRHSATNLKASVKMEREYADQATQTLRKVLGVPAAFIVAPGIGGFTELSAFGLGSGRIVYDNVNTASANIEVQGLI